MKRLATAPLLVFLLFVVGILPAADLTTTPAAIVRAPAVGVWTVVSADLSLLQPVPLDAGRSILLAQPGRYRVIWLYGGQTSTLLANVPDATPGPGPKPIDPPKPTPDPLPVPQPLAFVVVVEKSTEPADDVEIADIRLSAVSGEIAVWAKTAGVTVRVIDQGVTAPGGATPKQLAPVLAEAKGKALPWVVGTGAADPAGAAPIVLSQRCPATVAGVLALLKGAK